MNEQAKKVFTPGPMISFCSGRKLSSYLVRAKLYPIERTVGSFKCNRKRCQTYLNVNKTDTFTNSTTGKTYKINYQFNCNSKCLVYLLTCKVCLKQYVGQTVKDFRLRWNNYKSNDCKYLMQHLFEHFSSKGHQCFLDKISITFIDKTGPSELLKRENYWRSILKTMATWGLNVEENVSVQFIF